MTHAAVKFRGLAKEVVIRCTNFAPTSNGELAIYYGSEVEHLIPQGSYTYIRFETRPAAKKRRRK